MSGTYQLLTQHGEADPVFAAGPDGRQAVTRRQLLADVARTVHALKDAGWTGGQADGAQGEVLVICQDRYRFTVGVLAAWQAGLAVALPPNGSPLTLKALKRAPQVRGVLHDTDETQGLDVRELVAANSTGGLASLAPVPADRHVATVYTSGSTGDHTACPKTARQLLGEAAMLVEQFSGFGSAGRVVVATVPPHHIYGLLFGVLVPLMAGGQCIADTPLHAETVAQRLRDTGSHALVSVPAHWSGLAKLPPEGLGAIAWPFSSAAPLMPPVAKALHQTHALAPFEVLGSTETGGIAWRRQCQDPTWQALGGVAWSVNDAGLLAVDSPYLPPEAPRPFVTADRAQPQGDGFRHLGRADGVAKIAGKRVAVAEVTARLLALRGVRDAAVRAVSVKGPRQVELRAIVAASGWSVARLKTELRRWLDPAVVPRRFRLVDTLPRQANGKLTQAAFDALFERPPEPAPQYSTQWELAVDTDALTDVEDRRAAVLPTTYAYLEGHFDGFPILPGVAQIHDLILPRVAQRWPELGELDSIRRLKFKRGVFPGDLVAVSLKRNGARVSFTVSADGDVATSGHLQFHVVGEAPA